MHSPIRVAPPSERPVSLERAKLHLRLDDDGAESGEEDELVTALIEAAVSHLDGYSGILGRCLMQQTWRQEFDQFSRVMRLPLPATGVTTIAYVAPGGTDQTLSSTRWRLGHDARGSYVEIRSDSDMPSVDPGGRAVSIEFKSGAETADDVPAAIKQAILLMIGHWYANREAVVTGTIATALPMAVDALLAPWRRVGV